MIPILLQQHFYKSIKVAKKNKIYDAKKDNIAQKYRIWAYIKLIYANELVEWLHKMIASYNGFNNATFLFYFLMPLITERKRLILKGKTANAK